MAHTRSAKAHARALVYQALAEALAQAITGPAPGLRDLLAEAALRGAGVLGSPGCQKAARAFAEVRDAGREAPGPGQDGRNASFSSPPLAMYESLHRQGRLMGPIALEIDRRYRALGVTPAGGELPDHASVELAFLGHLAAAEAEAEKAGNRQGAARLRAEQIGFLGSHAAAWLPDVGMALASGSDAILAAVGDLLKAFLCEELSSPRHKLRGQTQLPTLRDESACSLCGLCIGSCRPGALRVIESDRETALTLDPATCTGCARCVRICPERALTLSSDEPRTGLSETEREGSGWLLRRSPRAVCAYCGQPTVSQAELAAVFARLQADPATRQRLSLCVACKS